MHDDGDHQADNTENHCVDSPVLQHIRKVAATFAGFESSDCGAKEQGKDHDHEGLPGFWVRRVQAMPGRPVSIGLAAYSPEPRRVQRSASRRHGDCGNLTQAAVDGRLGAVAIERPAEAVAAQPRGLSYLAARLGDMGLEDQQR